MNLLSRLLVLLGVVAQPVLASSDETGFTSLFNGRDLSGWEGNTAFWSVQDGAIRGRTTAERPLPQNTFLVWKGGEVANFDLRLQFRLTPDNPRRWANSGVQYRSRVIDPAAFVVGGYQADLDSLGIYVGMLYEEKGRGILMRPGERIRVEAGDGGRPRVVRFELATPNHEIGGSFRRADWNELRIVADGNRLQHFLNGVLTAEVIDEDAAKAASSGVLALQLHSGPPMTVEFKDIRLKNLP